MIDSGSSGQTPRLLVTIASFGERNLTFLNTIIARYKGMSLDVDVVVVSDAPKDLGADIEVVVGLPSSNPWSLPFAHKPIFAERVDHYDLFIYSEDDIEATEANIQAFRRATPYLAPDEIAGFLRYEIDETGDRSMPDVHGNYHWKPETVARRGKYTVAEFSNEHAAFYILTQDQLRKAIASGGFLREPYEGRYDMLCAAATDPYTSCGFRKVICVSELDDFLLHHMSNRYAGQTISLEELRGQVETLMGIAEGTHPATVLCEVESSLLRGRWSKDYYGQPRQDVVELVPRHAKRLLSVGCGWGTTELELLKRGFDVTALPLDSVIGAEAARRGIHVIYGTLAESLRSLDGQVFDCVLIVDLLHLLPNPRQLLEECARLVPGGSFVVSGPNFGALRIWASRMLRRQGFDKLHAFEKGGIHLIGPADLNRYLRASGVKVKTVRWLNPPERVGPNGRLGGLTARAWVAVAQSQALRPRVAEQAGVHPESMTK